MEKKPTTKQKPPNISNLYPGLKYPEFESEANQKSTPTLTETQERSTTDFQSLAGHISHTHAQSIWHTDFKDARKSGADGGNYRELLTFKSTNTL